MLKRLWKPVVGATLLVGAPSYLYFKYTSKPAPRKTFDLPVRVRGPDGKAVMMNRPIPLLTREEVDARLNEHAEAVSTIRPGGIVWKQATAFLAANSPIEDANASKVIERDPSDVSSPGDLLFFTVMDGHGGPYTSRLLSKVLIPAVALELALLIHGPDNAPPKASVLQDVRSLIWPAKTTSPRPSDADPQQTSLAIQRAFAKLDSEIVDSPLRLLADEMTKTDADKNLIPNLSQHPMAIASMLPAMSGESDHISL